MAGAPERSTSIQRHDENPEPLAALAGLAAIDPEMVRAVYEALGESPGPAFAILARVDERERVARDLHDVAIQSLIAITMRLNRMASSAPTANCGLHLREAVQEVEAVIGELREYIFHLRPRLAGHRTLGDALARVALDLERQTGIEIRVAVDRRLAELLGTRATELVKIVREALSNAIRHGRATHCRVSLLPVAASALLVIVDDGVGFDPMEVTVGQGLPNMRERATLAGGTFEVTSRVGGPTTVHVTLSLPRTAPRLRL